MQKVKKNLSLKDIQSQWKSADYHKCRLSECYLEKMWLSRKCAVQQRVNSTSAGLSVGQCCLFLSFVSGPLQHESCNRTFLPSPSHQTAQETHTSCPRPHLAPQQWDGEQRRGGNAARGVSCVFNGCQLSGATTSVCVQVLTCVCGPISYLNQSNFKQIWILFILWFLFFFLLLLIPRDFISVTF